MPRRVLEHLKSNLVAYVALFFALGIGTAWALERNSVRSKHIRDANVREADLGPLAVTPGKVDLLKHNVVGGTTSTTSASPEDTGQFGPLVTVNVPEGALVAVYAEVSLRLENGLYCSVHLDGPGLTSGEANVIMRDEESSFTTNYTSPGVESNVDADDFITNPLDAGWIVLNPGAGSHTYKLQYSAFGPSRQCSFTNRELYVGVVG